MSKHTPLLSLGYWFSSRTQGLVIHPYLTMRSIMRERFLRPLVCLPLVTWLMMWASVFLLVRLIYIGTGLFTGFLAVISGLLFLVPYLLFVLLWLTFFLLSWQIILGYLYFRFRKIYR